MARGQSGSLRVGFTENASWHGVVPESFKKFRHEQADAELQVNPLSSLGQFEGVRSGRLDAGYIFNVPKTDRELDQISVATHNIATAQLPD